MSQRTPIEFSTYRGINPYKCWPLYNTDAGAAMKQSDYEWCCIFEQYLEDYFAAAQLQPNEDEIIKTAMVHFDLDLFCEYYDKFEFTFEGDEEAQMPQRWLTDLEGFSKCLLVTVTEVDRINLIVLLVLNFHFCRRSIDSGSRRSNWREIFV